MNVSNENLVIFKSVRVTTLMLFLLLSASIMVVCINTNLYHKRVNITGNNENIIVNKVNTKETVNNTNIKKSDNVYTITKIDNASNNINVRTSVFKPIKKIKINDREVNCLAINIYYEAAGEPYIGKLAVGYATINRIHDESYPKTVCGVVYQHTSIDDNEVYQFSWVADDSREEIDREVWKDCIKVAKQVYYNYDTSKDPTHGAKNFYSNLILKIPPSWATNKKSVKIYNHTFVLNAFNS